MMELVAAFFLGCFTLVLLGLLVAFIETVIGWGNLLGCILLAFCATMLGFGLLGIFQ